MAAREKEHLFITVIGEDRKGIVARVSTLLFEAGININDINQKVTESYFIMTMLVDGADMNRPLEKLRSELQVLSRELGVQIQIQHENIFKMMHRV